VQRYTAAADQRIMADAGMTKMLHAQNANAEVANSVAKTGKRKVSG
jgi:hypothetical protein